MMTPAFTVVIFLAGAALVFAPRTPSRTLSSRRVASRNQSSSVSPEGSSLQAETSRLPRLSSHGSSSHGSSSHRSTSPRSSLTESSSQSSRTDASTSDRGRSSARLYRRLGVVGACAVAGLIHPVLIGLAALGFWLVPHWRRRVAAAKRTAALAVALPTTLDLFAVVLGSGGTISQSVAVVSRRGNAAVLPAFQLLGRRRAAGHGFVSVLSGLPEQLGEDYRPLVRALVATERDGAPIASLLLRLGEEASASRRRAGEARAKALSVQLLLPLVVCFLPAVIVGAIIPLVVVAATRFVT